MATRRDTIRAMGIGIGALAFVGSASAASSEIPALFGQWLSIRDRFPNTNEDDAEADRLHGIYVELQERITSATPRTVQDVAMQFWSTSDGGDSEVPDAFFAAMRRIALSEGRTA